MGPSPTCLIFPFVGNIIHKEYGGMIVYRIPKKEICWGKVTMETIASHITHRERGDAGTWHGSLTLSEKNRQVIHQKPLRPL